MSYYYKYNFVSPEPVYSTVKEELKSYFDTGAVDDLLFPTYLNKCLNKLGRTTYAITETILYIDDFQARLPDNFFAVREAWMCTSVDGRPYQDANSFYAQASSTATIQITPVVTSETCTNPTCTTDNCGGECMPTFIQAVYKTNNSHIQSFRREYLLQPGNISVREHCDLQCANIGASAANSFDIRDNKFVTNFRHGVVHLIFYATEYDNIGNQMIPDNYRIREFVEAFIKYKVFEMLSNQLTDETFAQIQQKLVYYKGLHDEAFIMAMIEIKKQTAWEKQRRIKNDLNRFNMYELPNRTNRYGRRRNN
jgi:hypothetical protein